MDVLRTFPVAGRLLVVSDEPEAGRALQAALGSEGFDAVVATNDADALAMVRDEQPHAAIIEVDEPAAREAALIRLLREESPRLPVIMLGADNAVIERVGRGLLRRKRDVGSEILRFADLVLDPTTHEVVRGERRIELTLTEFTLLELFLKHPLQVLPRALIFTTVWGFDFGSTSNALNVRIGQLRRKLEAGGEPRLIHTVRGLGYVLREP